MELGRKLHELWRLRVGLAISVTLALFAALWSVDTVSLSPLALKSRHLETSTASATALVEGPDSAVLDLRAATGNFPALTGRALLVANVMSSAAARSSIARTAGVPADAILISSPVTPLAPRPLVRPGHRASTSDIFRSPDEYRISLQSNPTVPAIDVYATAPSREAAARLADGAIRGTSAYLRTLAARELVPPSQQVRLRQLGRAEAATLDSGASLSLAVLAFLVVLALSCATTLFLSRLRRGWQLAGTHADGLPEA